MIRFACPGCAAVFNVDDAKAGKTGKCPKCQSQFVIPAAAAPVQEPESAPVEYSPPPLPAAAADGITSEIDPCPNCATRLSVAATDVGNDVECPYCKTVFRATKGGGGGRPPVLPPATSKEALDFRDEDDDRPSRRKKSSRRRDDDDNDDDRPRRKTSRRRRSNVESKRITAGILALLVGGLGVHKFYLGYTNAGWLTILLSCCTGVGGVIGFVEGIIYLTKTDEEFIEMYQVGTKEWF